MTIKNVFYPDSSIIKDIADIITSTDNVDSITHFILDRTLYYTRSEIMSVFLLDEKGGLVVRAAKGIESDLIPILRINAGEDICGRVFLEKTPLLVKNINSDMHVIKKGNGKYKTGSFICCPVMTKENVFGVINISDKLDGSAFTEKDLHLIETISSLTAIALEHSYLISKLYARSCDLDERSRIIANCDRSRTEFVARMSHKLRTPLNSIRGAIYYLKEKGGIDPEKSEFINIVFDESQKLNDLLNGILNFSCIEKEWSRLETKILSLKDIVKETVASKSIKDSLANNNISINIRFPESLPDIIGDKIRLIHSFIYIIDSIIKYTIAGDAIDLTAINMGTSVQVEFFVKERTIPENELTVIGDEHSLLLGTDVTGNNVKLYLAKKTIELRKGSISVQNTDKGISIVLNFPNNANEYRNARIGELVNLFLSVAAETMGLTRCSLMLSDEVTGDLTIKSAIGLKDKVIKNTKLKIGDQIAGKVANENKPLLIEDIEKDPVIRKKNEEHYNTKSLLCMPITIDDKVIGVLNLNNKSSGQPLAEIDLYLAEVITERIAKLIEKIQKDDLRNEEFNSTTTSMNTLLCAERKYKKRKSKLYNLVFGISRHMGFSEKEVKLSVYASAFYDLGLTQINEKILLKTGTLSASEQMMIRTHPFPGVGLINNIETDPTVKKSILHHHEKYDGSGYPDGLSGDNIPLISRVLAVADTYMAITTDRPYRKAATSKEAIEQVITGAGRQFDPKVIEAFVKTIRSS
jgi:HD-GYP domain-containing protein (c-di-GMP phosphodiesterase class II)